MLIFAEEGTVYTREFAIADIGLDSVVAACVTADKISLVLPSCLSIRLSIVYFMFLKAS